MQRTYIPVTKEIIEKWYKDFINKKREEKKN